MLGYKNILPNWVYYIIYSPYWQFFFWICLGLLLGLLIRGEGDIITTAYACSSDSELARELLLEKISKSRDKIIYFTEQVEGSKQILREAENRVQAALSQQALHENLSNLRAETRALEYYENKLQSGDYSLKLPSVAGTKRGI